MICFRDMTFCSFHEGCAEPCIRAYTKEVEKAALKWWGTFKIPGNPPVCFFSEIPSCYYPTEKNKNKTNTKII